jgi:hypothetical protein
MTHEEYTIIFLFVSDEMSFQLFIFRKAHVPQIATPGSSTIPLGLASVSILWPSI